MSDYGAELLKRQLTGKYIILLGHIGEPHKKNDFYYFLFIQY